MAKSISEPEQRTIVELFKAGRSVPQIADELGRGHHTIQEHLAAAGQLTLRPPKRLNDTQIEALVTRYAKDKQPVRVCANELKVPPTTVRRALLSAGVQLRAKGRPATTP